MDTAIQTRRPIFLNPGQPTFFRNTALAVFFLVGVTSEIAVARYMSGHALWSGGLSTAVALIYLVWFWFTLAGVLGFISNWVTRLTIATWPAGVAQIVAGILLAGCAFVYITSWGIYLQTGRFANWEAIRFTLLNWSMLRQYMLAADKSQVVWAVVIGLASVAASPAVVRAIGRGHLVNTVASKRRLFLWLILTLTLLLAKQALMQDIQREREFVDRHWSLRDDIAYQTRFANLDRLNACLNPAAALWASGVESWYTEPLEACLDESALAPRSTAYANSTGSGKNVIIVAVESLRNDTIGLFHQGKEVLPNINQLAAQGLVFSRAYAQSTHSDYADVCLVSSLYPLRSRKHHFYHADDPWPRTMLHDVLHEVGYATAIISSQNESWGGMDRFLTTDNLDWFYHPGRRRTLPDRPFKLPDLKDGLLAGKFPDRHTTDVAVRWIEYQTSRGDPFCLSMNLQSSHFPHLIPADAPRPFQPAELDSSIKFSSYPEDEVPVIRNAYFNAIQECDRQVGRLVKSLKKLGIWRNTILVVTGENGEAFNENGCAGHACNPTEPVLRVAAVVSAPGLISARVEEYPFEHVDLAPTVLHLLGMDSHPNFQGIDILSQNRVPLSERLLFFHVLSPIARADAVLLAGRWKYMVSHDKPLGVLYDLDNDPSESTDLSTTNPMMRRVLATAVSRWRAQQLAYYHFAAYYERFYPPRPPTLTEACEAAGLDVARFIAGERILRNSIREAVED